jgi:hypothetical protein
MKKYLYSLFILLCSAQVEAQLAFDYVEVFNPNCHGECTGQINVNAYGTQGPYTYSIDGGATYTSQNYFFNLCAGSYNVYVQDVTSGQTIDTTLVITEPAPIGILPANIVNPSCAGSCDGSIAITPSGGTVSGPNDYWYEWSDGSQISSFPNSNVLTGLCSGQFACLIGDANECYSDTFFIDVQAPPGIGYYADIENISCNGANDGVITFMSPSGGPGASGGTPFAGNNYQFSINEGITFQSSPQFTNLTPGAYELIVSDSLGCIVPITEHVFEPSAISFSVTSSNPTACNVADGYLVFSGLTQDSTYILSGLDQFGIQLPPITATADQFGQITINNIGSEQLSDFTVDLNTCSGFLDTTIYLVAPTNGFAMNTGSAVVSDASCANTDGSITGISVSGGSGIYTYHYTGGSSAPDLTNAQPGSYMLTVTDSDGCVIESNSFTINSTISNIVLSSTSSSATCHGSCDGLIELFASGGDGNYSYLCSNGMLGDSLSDVCPGTHTVWVTDGLGCQAVNTVSVSEPALILNTISSVAPTCGSNDGSAEVSATTGGITPYSYQWSSGSTSELADSLLAGVYTVTVTDNLLCSVSEQVNITSSSGPNITSNIIDASCNGGNDGEIDLTITGGTAPYNIDWSTGEHTEDISGLAAGIYDVTIFDDVGCGSVHVFSVSESLPIDLSAATIVDASCSSADGMISVSASGGVGGYNYLWSFGSTTADATNLAAGTYSLSISDNNLCTANASYTVSNSAGPSIIVEQVIQPVCQGGIGEILVSVTGGVAPYSYSWSNGANSEDLFNAPVGNYELIVTDSNGCQGVQYSELLGVNLNAAEICMVTVDTATGANVVVWNKENNLGISEYEVHKETSSLNVFQLLGTVSFDSLSQFIDTAANSSVHSYRYKLRTIDSCGNFSEFLAYHKTIHLVSNIGLNNTVNLVWDDYIGFEYLTFYINRYHPSTGWVVLDSVASNVHSYTDNSYPTLNGLEYDIEVVPTSPCSAEKAQDHNTTRSNRHTIAPPTPPNSIDESLLLNARVHPNPSIGLFTIIVEASNWTYSILDMNGKLIMNETASTNKAEVNIEALEAGIYMIQISVEGDSIYKKIVKQ